MAAPTLTAVMAGIETRLKTIAGLRTTPFRPDQANPPQAFISVPEIEYHKAFHHGTMAINPQVTILISKALDRMDQPMLASFMDTSGANSVHAAIEADKTLGLSANGVDCIVERAVEADLELGGIRWYAAVFTLKVTATGGA